MSPTSAARGSLASQSAEAGRSCALRLFGFSRLFSHLATVILEIAENHSSGTSFCSRYIKLKTKIDRESNARTTSKPS
jgi:hypothetical protein